MRSLETLRPTEALEMENGLTLVPRVRLTLTVYPLSPSITKPIDEWKLKFALLHFLKSSLSVSVLVPEEDLHITRSKDLKKRKREDPVARGTLFVRDLGFLNTKRKTDDIVEEDNHVENKVVEWRKYLVDKMCGIELNLEGLKFRLTVAVPIADDFEGLRKDWEEFYAFRNRGHSKSGRREPDTIIMRGVPSRWFAEPRVSSNPSMLVTHTIFSCFGKIRNLSVTKDDDLGEEADKDGADIVSGLHCKIVVQFEKYVDFYNALKVLCGRSLEKQGSRLRSDYEVTWDKDGFFRNSINQTQEKNSRMLEMVTGGYRSEAPRREPQSSQFKSDDTPRKRFKD
ncbi:hypothetical protein CFOL_v3_00124 [Cephalotus follicularis]|uniref:Uncharacterized protein n=1 Tax=Cephalotus follicularis TaxID=3775 RepID=A0A1Q3ALY8_CEPFO|nr:hypothetical protein CFOL_v3_00124 [Cephalotus follicularis]